jgi:type I restriction enzyme S subunit
VKENVAELRKAILQLAVMGKLVPQNPNDPPASQLLKDIEAEKSRLWRDGKIKTPKPLLEIKPAEIPYALPQGWEWVRLIEIGYWALGSGLPHSIQGDTEQEILLCKVSDMNLPGNEKFIIASNNTVSEETAKASKLTISEPGTIIFPKIGGAIATNKRRILQKRTVIDNNCLGITPYSLVNLEWAYQLLLSFDFSKYQTGTSVPAISQGIIGEIVIGLPPAQEQDCIVHKIIHLMAACDALEQQIDAATSKQTELLDALMAQM